MEQVALNGGQSGSECVEYSQIEDNKLIYLIEGVQIISFIMIIIISSFMVNIYILTFPLLNYLFLWILVIAYRIYKQTSNKLKKKIL